MESKVKLFGHPIDPMLVVFPLGLLATAALFDVLYLTIANAALPAVSFYMIAAGVVGGLLAAIFGFMDWLGLPGNSRARNLGAWHGIGNFVIVVTFAVSWLLRRDNPNFIPDGVALILSLAGVGLALFTWWIGGELVCRLGVAVDPGANVNAPSSLTERKPVTASSVKRASHR